MEILSLPVLSGIFSVMPLFLKESIKQIGPNSWLIGSLVCERTNTKRPDDAIAAWEEDDYTYILRAPKDNDIASPPPTSVSDVIEIVHEGGTESVVWTIGRQVFCKVKIHIANQESEAHTINFVQKVAPQISTPAVIHTWTEHDRSFLLLTRIQGSTLRDAWIHLTPSQRTSAVETVARYCELLARHTSPTLRSVTGKPLLEPFLAISNFQLLGPLTHEDCMSHFSLPSPDCPALGAEFHFYHPDLGPSNIIISDDGSLAGIIDWEAAGYYPRFWIATKPAFAPGLDFDPSVAGFEDFEWRKRLRVELENLGFPQAVGWWVKWNVNRRAQLSTDE